MSKKLFSYSISPIQIKIMRIFFGDSPADFHTAIQLLSPGKVKTLAWLDNVDMQSTPLVLKRKKQG